MALTIVDVFPQFHYFPAVRVGCYGHMAGGVQVDTDPTGCQECSWMKSDHLFPIVSSTALRKYREVHAFLGEVSSSVE